MPSFRATAYDAEGNKRTVRREAAGEDELIKALALEGYVPISVEMESGGAGAESAKRLSLGDQHLYCAMLGAFLQSGLSLVEVLGLLGKQTKDKGLKSVY